MPFKSKAQEKWMYANKPSMAKKWSAHTKNEKSLPEKVHRSSAKASAKKLGY